MFFAAHMARARLRDRHQESLRRKLQVLKAEQAVVATDVVESADESSPSVAAPISEDTFEPIAGPSGSSQPHDNQESEEET